MNPDQALALLEKRLGPYRLGRDWANFCCPFCSDIKYRFGVNLTRGNCSCWNCEKKGWVSDLFDIDFKGSTDAPTKRRLTSVKAPPISGLDPLVWSPLPGPGEPCGLLAQQAFDYLKTRDIDSVTAWALDLGYGREGPWLGTVIHPYYYDNGMLAGWQGRYIDPGTGPKVRTAQREDWDAVLRPQEGGLYLLDRVREGEPIVICEGPYDALSVSNVMPAVACFGSVLHPAQVRRMEKRKPSKYIIGWDPDKSVSRAAAVLNRNSHRPVEYVSWPPNFKTLGLDFGDLDVDAVAYLLGDCCRPWKIGELPKN